MNGKLFVAILALLFSSTATSEPMYYTFTGVISRITDSAGAVAQANNQNGVNLVPGAPAEYVFLIDTEAPGQATLNDGSIVVREDTEIDGEITDFIFTDLVNESLIDEVDGGFHSSDPAAVAEYNFGQQVIPPPPFEGYTVLVGGSADNYVIINNSTLIANWEIEILPETGPLGYFVGFERAFDSDGNVSFIETTLGLTAITPISKNVTIDIKPAREINKINLSKKRSLIPVAVLGSTDFDAAQIDYSTVKFGPAGAPPAHQGHVKDVNGDGFIDMKFHFKTKLTGIECGDIEASLVGETFDGVAISGKDAIKTVKCN